nr:hypothetical protein [Ralstonia pseudosolanacearum]
MTAYDKITVAVLAEKILRFRFDQPVDNVILIKAIVPLKLAEHPTRRSVGGLHQSSF